MSHDVTCPKCGHEFEADEEFEKYEKLIADIVKGKVMPPGMSGYDVIDSSGMTYQVKHTKRARKTGLGYSQWKWDIRTKRLFADFIALVSFHRGERFIFLIDKFSADRKIKSRTKRIDYSKSSYCIYSAVGPNSWIWDYYVTPESFMRKRDELMKAQQLALEISFA